MPKTGCMDGEGFSSFSNGGFLETNLKAELSRNTSVIYGQRTTSDGLLVTAGRQMFAY